MLNIPSVKQLSLTATMKQISGSGISVISNDNEIYFGKVIEKRDLLWTIKRNIVCDYIVQTIITDEKDNNIQFKKFNIDNDTDKRLFLSAFASLKSINDNNSHHLLMYSNSTENSEKLIKYIELLLDNKFFIIPDLYYSNYHSAIKIDNRSNILSSFEKSKFGIISCIFCLGEGFDLPLLDGVVFCETMTSNIRIVQSALRASRKNKNEPNKITKIILPILNKQNWLNNKDNNDFKKVCEVVYQMAQEDTEIMMKVRVCKINVEKQNDVSDKIIKKDIIGIYDEELTQQLRLKSELREKLGITLNKAKEIIAENAIKSKKEYYELCNVDCRLTKNPDVEFNQFKGWIDYLSIERKYYTLSECKNNVGEYIKNNPNIKKKYHSDLSGLINQLVSIDPLFPPNDLWIDYYGNELDSIITLSIKKKKTGCIS